MWIFRALLVWLAVAAASLQAARAQPHREIEVLGEGTNRRLIVFVHGLWGDRRETFGAWPALIAAERAEPGHLGRYGVALLGYQSGRRATLTPRQIATNLLSHLENVVARNGYEGVAVVAHSLGGIITQQILLDAINAAPTVSERTRAVFLLGTPGRGAPLANFVSRLPIANDMAGEVVRWLQTIDGNHYLADLEQRWDSLREGRQPAGRVPLYCVEETAPYLGFVIVPPTSFVRPCTTRYTADGRDHVSLVKPATASDPVYVWVRDRILRHLEPAAAQPPTTLSPPAPPGLRVGQQFCRMDYGLLNDRGFCAVVVRVAGQSVRIRLEQVHPVATIGRDSDTCTGNRRLRELNVGAELDVPVSCVPAALPLVVEGSQLPRVGHRFCTSNYGALKDRGYCASVVRADRNGVVLRLESINPVRTVGHELDACSGNRRLRDLAVGGEITVPASCVPQQ